jgi:signal transduction histidine kinase
VATSGNQKRLLLKLPINKMEMWQKDSLQLWSLVKIGKLPWNWKRKKCVTSLCKCDKSCKKGEEFCAKVSDFYLTILLPIDSMHKINRSAFRIRLIIVIMSFLLILVVSLVWNKNLKEISLRSSLLLAKEHNKHLHEMNLAASGLAHETKNPLNTVRMATQTLSTMTPESKKFREMISLIINEVDRLSARINQWLAYSKPVKPKFANIKIDALLKELYTIISFDAEDKEAKIEIHPSFFIISADREMLRQLLFNMMLNAIQAVDSRGQITVKVVQNSSTKASIIVEDNGVGVSDDVAKQLFAPYFTTKDTGTGLGLAICKKIAFSHGWKIFYEKCEKNGSRFILDEITIITE